MSNFLKNLAKRGAGLPLSTEFFPAPSATFESGTGPVEGIEEITLEETSTSLPKMAISVPHQTVDASPADEIHGRPASVSYDSQQALTKPGTVSQLSLKPGTVVARPVVALGPRRIEPLAQTDRRSQSDLAGEPRARPAAFAPADGIRDAGGPGINERVEVGREWPSVQTILPAMTLPHPEPDRPSPPQKSTESQTPLQPQRSTESQTPLQPQSSTLEEKPTEPQKVRLLANQTIRPVSSEPSISFHLPAIPPAAQPASASAPIHVHVGRIEVRGNAPQQASTVQAPKQTVPLGFAAYQRLRRYRI